MPLRTRVLREAIPTPLATLVGGPDVIIGRLPEVRTFVRFEPRSPRTFCIVQNYLRALFGSRLASRFIYASGIETPAFAFFE